MLQGQLKVPHCNFPASRHAPCMGPAFCKCRIAGHLQIETLDKLPDLFQLPTEQLDPSMHNIRIPYICVETTASLQRPSRRVPGEPSTNRRAQSACAAPAIMLGTKSLWPGASSRVTARWLVLKRDTATSTVTPLARSSGRSSSSQAHAKDPFPACAAACLLLCTCFWSTSLQQESAFSDDDSDDDDDVS